MTEDWLEKSNRSIGAMFDEIAARYGDKEALVYQDRRLTYGQLRDKVNRLARGLLKLGVKKGDHVAIWGTNKPEWVYAQFAALKLGASITPVNTRFKASEVEYVLRQSDTSTLVFEEHFLGKIDAAAMLRELAPELASGPPGKLASSRFPVLKNVICWGQQKHPGIFSLEEVMGLGDGPALDEALRRAQAGVSPDDIGYIMYTSGTTGFPKGAMLPQRNTLALFYLKGTYSEITDQSIGLLMAPIFTNFGSTGAIIQSFCRGAKVVLIETFDAEEAMKAIEKERVTWFAAIPSMLIMMLAHPNFKKYDLSSVKTIAVGGAPVTQELARAVREKTRIEFMTDSYGLVEATGVSNILSTRLAPWEELGKTVGPALPYCRVKVVDIKSWQDLPPGQEGEIWVTNDTTPPCTVMKGYYNKPKETEEAIVNGWLRTGDMGKLREDGYLQLTGRLKEMVLVGGFNVYPAEVEGVLATHPKVEMSAVVAVPDPRLGEVPYAFIKLKKGMTCTEDEIIDFSRNRMANTKVPRGVKFVSEFPMTASGKIQKFLLKERVTKGA